MDLVYKKAGRLELIRYGDGKRYLFNGSVQSIAPQITTNTTTLPDGNSSWDLTFSSGKAAQVAITLNSFQPTLYAALVGANFADAVTAGLTLRKIEENTIPESTPFTVSVSKTPSGDPVVHNEENSPFVKVATSPLVGQFSASGTALTFSSADAGKEIIIAYDTSPSSAKHMDLPSESFLPIFRAIVAGEAATRKNEAVTKSEAIIFDRVAPTGDLAYPSRQREPQTWSFTLQIMKPRPGYKTVDAIWEE